MPTLSHAPASCCRTPLVFFGYTYVSTTEGDHAQASTPGGVFPISSPGTFAYRCALPVFCISGRGLHPHLHRRQLPAAARLLVAALQGGIHALASPSGGAIPMPPSTRAMSTPPLQEKTCPSPLTSPPAPLPATAWHLVVASPRGSMSVTSPPREPLPTPPAACRHAPPG